MTFEFWKKGLDHASLPEFSHEPRWSTTSSLKRFFSPAMADQLHEHPSPSPMDHLPSSFSRWGDLSQVQYLEISTLLSPYIISSQGDRMLMAHSVEGRFPFLDREVMEFCNMLPAEYKLAFLNEKRILKEVAKGLVPEPIIRRKKQPYRAPDAASFLHPNAPDYIQELFSDHALQAGGLFHPPSVHGLYKKCMEKRDHLHEQGAFSNTDNMAFVGILSTQLLVHDFIQSFDARNGTTVRFKTIIDHVSPSSRNTI
jgi:asparagine synthase (glutamine-hydrolysing)